MNVSPATFSLSFSRDNVARYARFSLPTLLLVLSCLPSTAQNRAEEQVNVSQQLDNLHKWASDGDFDAYFDLYDETAIFLGTDATERWTVEEFKDYSRPVFARGSGWTYIPTARNVYLSESGDTAWFDEMLQNENLGVTRGTGVLVKRGDDWKIVQYNLTLPVPNQLAREFVGRIRALPEQQ